MRIKKIDRWSWQRLQDPTRPCYTWNTAAKGYRLPASSFFLEETRFQYIEWLAGKIRLMQNII